jgi:hypothetical protein
VEAQCLALFVNGADRAGVDRQQVGDAPGDAALFVLRIGEDPLPQREEFQSAVILSPADMRAMMEEPGLPEGEAE